MNQSPTPYRFIQTEFCKDETSLTVENLTPYSEKAMALGLDLVPNCRVSIAPVIGKNSLQRQVNWIRTPRTSATNRQYHLRIRVYPTSPPVLTLEPIDIAIQRFKEAGRPFPGS